MKANDIIQAAWEDVQVEDMDSVELQLWHTMRLLFCEYRLKLVTKEEAAYLKQQAINAFETDRRKAQQRDAMVAAYIELFDSPHEECRKIAQKWRKFF